MNSEHTGRTTGEISIPMDANEAEIETCIFDQMVASGMPIEVAAEAAPQLAREAMRQRDMHIVTEGDQQARVAELEALTAAAEAYARRISRLVQIWLWTALAATALAGISLGITWAFFRRR